MSLPFLTYACSNCDLSTNDALTWGRRIYARGDETCSFRAAIGWCHDCADLTPVEQLPGDAERRRTAELADGLTKLRADHAEQLARHESRIRWYFKPKVPQAVLELEYRIRVTGEELDRLRDRQRLLVGRESGARCLDCGRANCEELPASPVEAEFRPEDTRPVRLGFRHPNCDGEITVRCSGASIGLAPQNSPNVYNIEGELISGPDHRLNWR